MRLPPYGNITSVPGIPGDKIQAIVPEYRFNCSGTVTGWGGCFAPATSIDYYFISYQVWREIAPGCYHLIGPTSPHTLQPDNGCGITTLSADEYITVQEGDVLGFHSDHVTSITELVLFNFDFKEAGFQMATGEDYPMKVFYRQMLLEETSITSYVAVDVGECMAVSSNSSVLQLNVTGAPIISVMFGKLEALRYSCMYCIVVILEPAETQQPSPDSIPDADDMMTSVSTLIFSSFTTSSIIESTIHTISTSHLPHTESTLPSLLQPTTLHLTMSATPNSPPPVLSDIDSTQTGDGNHDNYYKKIALAASLLIFINIILLVGVCLLTVVCIRRRRRRRIYHNTQITHEISSPHNIIGVDTNVRRSNFPESRSFNRSSSSEERISMISNCLYVRSPARAFNHESKVMTTHTGGCSDGSNGENIRPAVESMIYNEIYASFQTRNAENIPENNGLTSKTIIKDTDSDGYEYIR